MLSAYYLWIYASHECWPSISQVPQIGQHCDLKDISADSTELRAKPGRLSRLWKSTGRTGVQALGPLASRALRE